MNNFVVKIAVFGGLPALALYKFLTALCEMGGL